MPQLPDALAQPLSALLSDARYDDERCGQAFAAATCRALRACRLATRDERDDDCLHSG